MMKTTKTMKMIKITHTGYFKLLGFFVFLIVGSFVFLINNYYLNIFSDSLPMGIYQKSNGAYVKGAYVATCLNEEIASFARERGFLMKGFCSTKIVPVMKIIYGVPGDHYRREGGKLFINEEAFQINYDYDSEGRLLKYFYPESGIIQLGEYMLLSEYNEKSWDSRYWGPVKVEFLLKPILIRK